MRRLALAAALTLLPAAATAHAAFGDLGPFYASFLHPLADPGQGLLIAAAAVLLARQPLATIRPAYAALAFCGALAVALHAFATPPPLASRATGIAVALLGVLALSGLRLGVLATAALVAAAALFAGFAIDLPPGARPGVLAALGGAAGIALLALLVWGGVDLAIRRIGPVAGAVAGSWIAAIGLMTAVLPG